MNTPKSSKEIPSVPNSATFTGTENPRHLRAIDALLTQPMSRKRLDMVVGCLNGPQLVAGLRKLGLELPCAIINVVDRDGCTCRTGVYSLTDADRLKLHQWQAKRGAA